MEGFHCSIDDIPCYDASTITDPAQPSPSGTVSPSSARDDFGRSSSPTASPSGTGIGGVETLLEACFDVGETCLEDVTCADCYPSDDFELAAAGEEGVAAAGESFSECRSDYLGTGNGSGSGSGSGSATTTTAPSSSAAICDVIGSAFCCSEGSGCQVDGLSVAYWLCVFDFFGCSMEEAACVGGGSQSSRGDDDDNDGTSAGYGYDDVGGGGGGGGVSDNGVVTVRSGGAAESGRCSSSSAAAYAYLSAGLAGALIAVVASLV